MTDDTALNTRLTDRYHDYYVSDDGDVIVKRQVQRKEPSSGDLIQTTIDVNMTRRYRVGPRKTSNVDYLVIEAELTEETGDAGNAAIPIDDETEQAARSRIEGRGLTPAWEVA